ncbi:glycosyltransferase [Chryseobacterium sp. MFBS3-17]|uniref:glycosyltransferase n=1 Tax=Chryseobacterium sp. MFBS3-17 TaxID=2886689 RepID=UPI001D0F31D3|nr:glycosyltransferase [Chryseobacterium sp. MFBS3-17]MCC2591362.1 glycosyltransferase [Chryseobacterium sp. MFBS3-17]
MRILFVHDHPFYQDNDNKVYTGGAFPDSIWNNYLMNFDEINIYARRSKSLASKKAISSGNVNVNFFLTDLYSSVSGLFKNYNLIKKELTDLITKNDVILVRLPSVLGFITAEIAMKLNKKIWVEQVGNASEALGMHGSLLGKFAAPIFDKFNRKYVSKANYITYVTKYKLQKDYPHNDKAIVTNLSNVIIKKILNNSEIDNQRFFLQILKIGLIGGFDVRYKGQDILLKAINELPKHIKSNIEIYFIGKGNFDWINEMAKSYNLNDNIKFIGALMPGDEINEMLKNLSLYVQPSFTEGMPRATIEAMAMGCPVIGSNVGGIPELITNSFIHDSGNYQLLSKHILELYNNRKLLKQESNRSLIKAEDYLLDNLINRRKKFYSLMNEDIEVK